MTTPSHHYPHGHVHLPARERIVPNILQTAALVLALGVLFAIFGTNAKAADLQVMAITSICLAVVGQTWPPSRR